MGDRFTNALLSILVFLLLALCTVPNIHSGSHLLRDALGSCDECITPSPKNERLLGEEDEKTSRPWETFRLPDSVVPLHYDLKLHPELTGDTYQGNVNITINVTQFATHLVLHSFRLIITDSYLFSTTDGEHRGINKRFLYDPNEYFVMEPARSLLPGIYVLGLRFAGSYQHKHGIFKSFYNEGDETKYLVVTYFEPTFARRVFPCFDEPHFRATFNLSLVHPSTHFALSNAMVQEVIEADNDLKETRFETSLPMPTYLLCFVISDFKYKEDLTDKGVRLRVYAAPHLVNHTSYALEIGSQIISYFETYFDIPFSLKKLDMIAIPDFAIRGMENWGLVTYRDSVLLWNEESSILEKRRTVRVVAHELAHMWFGDLVSIQWWDDLWLKEGFASYVARKGVQNVEPETNEEMEAALSVLFSSMTTDCRADSHPIINVITKTSDAQDMFDIISYHKGSSVLRMLENIMKEDFQKGVTAYLRKYALGNARTVDLWHELTEASSMGLNITNIMDSWLKQMNYPYVTVERDEANPNTYILRQRRFLEDEEEMLSQGAQTSPYNYVWQIPLTYHTSHTSQQILFLMDSEEAILSIPSAEWVKFNVNFTGHYLVKYGKKEWQHFIKLLLTNHTIFSMTDRYNLLFDSYMLSSARLLEYDIPLAMTFYLKNEREFAPWSAASQLLDGIKKKFKVDTETRSMLQEYVRNLAKDPLKQLTWSDTGSYTQKILRELLIQLACGNDDRDCLEVSKQLFMKWMQGDSLKSVLGARNLIFFYGLQAHCNEDSWNFVWDRYLKASDPGEKNAFLEALANVRNETLLQRLMDYGKNESLVLPQTYLGMLENIAANPRGHFLVMHFLYMEWNYLKDRYVDDERVEYLARSVFSRITTEDGLKKVEEFYRRRSNARFGEIHRHKAIRTIKTNIRWLQMHKTEIELWLKTHVSMPWLESRLPLHVTPKNYDLKIRANLLEQSFKGSVEIVVNVSEDTDYVLLHQKGLVISKTEVELAENNSPVEIYESFAYEKNAFWVVRFAKKISSGIYVLRLEFSGKFATARWGMKRFVYSQVNTEGKKYFVTTRFEPTGARYVFPCFDEPVMKANFKLTLVHEPKYNAISNMPMESRTFLDANLVETKFALSLPMSSYLLCWVISEFDFLEASYNKVKVRVYAPTDRLHKAQYALNATLQMLRKYEEFFDVPFALPKLDSASLPNYVVPAIEHWGIITYHERRFLVDEASTEKDILYVNEVIAHELAHQWFGNLVTMEWWNDIWLNEGFSTFASYALLKEIYPKIIEKEAWRVSATLLRDSTLKSHPVVHHIQFEMQGMFDEIAYDKGSALLKMLQYVLKENFKKGISNYLKKYAFRNAATQDLWSELSEASDLDINVTDIMNTWTRQMGFPVINVQRDNDSFTATQSWFLNEKNSTAILAEIQKSPFRYVWKIPLTYKNLNNGEEGNVWLNEEKATFEIEASRDEAIKFNPNFIGYYIVNYDSKDWVQLIDILKEEHEVMSVVDRFNLLQDAFFLAEAGRLPVDVPLDMTGYLKNEKELMPWRFFKYNFHDEILSHLERNSETVVLWKEYVRNLTQDMYDVYALDINESYYKVLRFTGMCSTQYSKLALTSVILDLSCDSDNARFMQLIQEQLDKWKLGEKVMLNEDVLLSLGALHFGNNELWELLYKRLTKDGESKDNNVLLGLASFKDPFQIKKSIDLMMWEEAMDDQNAQTLLMYLSKNSYALPFLWEYVKEHWDQLLERLQVTFHPPQLLYILCPRMKTRKYLSDIQDFRKGHPEMHPLTIKECVEDIQDDLKWADSYENDILRWLHKWKS